MSMQAINEPVGQRARAVSKEDAESTFGGQTIGLMGSIALMVNNVVGPGIVALPLVYQQAGWLTPTIAITFAFLSSSMACTMVCQAIQSAPGNRGFKRRMEYCDMVVHFIGHPSFAGYPRLWHYLSQFFYNVCLTCLNIGSIVVTAQTMDQIILFIFHKTFALQFAPHFRIINTTDRDDTPFQYDPDNNHYPLVLTLGYLVSCAGILPMGYMTLEDNIIFQFAAFTVFSIITAIFLGYFLPHMESSRVPMIGDDVPQSIGVSLFCYSYAIAIPSWVNEKRADVSINRTIWYSAFPSTILKIAFGWFGGLAFSTTKMTDNVLQTVVDTVDHGAFGTVVRLGDFFFSLFVIGFGVPLFHIFVRYNLVNGGVCRPATAGFWGVIFPWMVSWLVYNGTLYEDFMNWSSLFFNAITCYILPFITFTVSAWLAQRAYEGLVPVDWEPDVADHMEGEDPQPTWGTAEADYVTDQKVDIVKAVPWGNPVTWGKCLCTITVLVIFVAVLLDSDHKLWPNSKK